jgi:hypothetical protein
MIFRAGISKGLEVCRTSAAAGRQTRPDDVSNSSRLLQSTAGTIFGGANGCSEEHLNNNCRSITDPWALLASCSQFMVEDINCPLKNKRRPPLKAAIGAEY